MGNGTCMEKAPSTRNPYPQRRFYLSGDGDEDDFDDGDGDGKAFPGPTHLVVIPNDSFLT